MSDREATSTAEVPTDRAARFGKQLSTHLGRRHGGHWDVGTGTGHICFGETAVCQLSADASALHLVLQAPASRIEELEDVVSRHLLRFGGQAELVCTWRRNTGPEPRD